jgi:hypothetical protein
VLTILLLFFLNGLCVAFVSTLAELGDCVRRRRWYRKRIPITGSLQSLFMLGAPGDATAVHVKTEDAQDWSAAVPLRSLGTHGILEVGGAC